MIDKTDMKILYELDRDSRQPLTRLAKKLRLNRNTVEYRINQLVDRGVIKQFVTIFNPLAFNNQLYKIYLQLQDMNQENEKEIVKYLQTLPLYWLAKSYGRWDFLVGIRADTPKEFNKIKLEILSRLESHIVNKNITLMVNAPFFDRDYLVNNKAHKNIRYFLDDIKISIDDKDKEILKLISTNSRIRSTEIAGKLDMAVKTAIERIKRLERGKVIVGYKISLDHEKIGYRFMKAFISLKNVSGNDRKRFINYCMNLPNLIHLVECIGEWDFEPEFEIKDEQEFFKIISNLRNGFSNIIRSVDVITIMREYEYKAY